MTKELRKIRIARNKRRARIMRRRRIFTGLIGLICTLAIITGITVISAEEICATKIVTVERGDSLWSLVSEHCSENDNIRRIIAEVKKINDLDNSCLQVGDSLIIPIYG